MSDTPKSVETEPDTPLAGMRLAEARRAQDISVLDIAKELHLDEPKIQALEENDFDALGAPVFAKGHLRKYAELVGVPMDDILADYYALTRSSGAPPVVGSPRNRERDFNLGRWLKVIVIVVLLGAAAAAAYWWYEHQAGEAAVQADAGVLAPFAATVESDLDASSGHELTLDPSASVGVRDTGEDSGAAFIEAALPEPVATDIVSAETSSTPSDVPQATLTMNFSGDCWTEVSDATGKRLYFDLGVAGRNVTVTGAAPLRALFGDSTNVRVVLNGEDYVIPAAMRSGRTARLTVNAP
ncbi:MAG: helix-turn-helix domain-containing protein [Proteobacteria bacterium]|nr:helix-turn-helix domain-containing protein [Pseudomonadota bacterium]